MSGQHQPVAGGQERLQRHPIKTLQYLLRARGHSVVVDGVFGPEHRRLR